MSASIYLFVMSKLNASRGSWPEIARKSGVSKRTIEKIARREIEDPGVSHIEKLADHFGYTPRKAAAMARQQKRAVRAGVTA